MGQVDHILPNGAQWGRMELSHPDFWIIKVPKIDTPAAIEKWSRILKAPQIRHDDGTRTRNRSMPVRRRRYKISLPTMDADKANHLRTHKSRMVDMSPLEFRACIMRAVFCDAYGLVSNGIVKRLIDDPIAGKISTQDPILIQQLLEQRRFKNRKLWRNKTIAQAVVDERKVLENIDGD